MARASSREATIAVVVKVEKVDDQCEIRVLGNDHKPSRFSRSEAEDEGQETVGRQRGSSSVVLSEVAALLEAKVAGED